MARLLLYSGAEVDARNKSGDTPLHDAAWNNSTDAARLLIDRGADADGIDLSWMEDSEDA